MASERERFEDRWIKTQITLWLLHARPRAIDMISIGTLTGPASAQLGLQREQVVCLGEGIRGRQLQ